MTLKCVSFFLCEQGPNKGLDEKTTLWMKSYDILNRRKMPK